MNDMEYLDKLLNGDESVRKEFGKNSIVNIKFENKKHDYKKDKEDLENKLKNREEIKITLNDLDANQKLKFRFLNKFNPLKYKKLNNELTIESVKSDNLSLDEILNNIENNRREALESEKINEKNYPYCYHFIKYVNIDKKCLNLYDIYNSLVFTKPAEKNDTIYNFVEKIFSDKKNIYNQKIKIKQKNSLFDEYIESKSNFDFNFIHQYYLDKFKKFIKIEAWEQNFNMILSTKNIRHFHNICFERDDEQFIKYIQLRHQSIMENIKDLEYVISYYKNITDNIYKEFKLNNSDISRIKKMYAKYFYKYNYLRLLHKISKSMKMHFINTYLIIVLYCHFNKLEIKKHKITIDYKIDKVQSYGSCVIYNKLFEMYKNNNKLIAFFPELRLPINKSSKYLWADYYCIYINKFNQIKHMIIEFNGNHHYDRNTLYSYKEFDKIKERDVLKEEYATNNNINFIIITYNVLDIFDEIIIEEIEDKCKTIFV
jgi:hypothetical protein